MGGGLTLDIDTIERRYTQLKGIADAISDLVVPTERHEYRERPTVWPDVPGAKEFRAAYSSKLLTCVRHLNAAWTETRTLGEQLKLAWESIEHADDENQERIDRLTRDINALDRKLQRDLKFDPNALVGGPNIPIAV